MSRLLLWFLILGCLGCCVSKKPPIEKVGSKTPVASSKVSGGASGNGASSSVEGQKGLTRQKALIVVPGNYASQLIFYGQVASVLQENGFSVTMLILATVPVARNYKPKDGVKAVIIEADPENRYTEFKKEQMASMFSKANPSLQTVQDIMDLLAYFTESSLKHKSVFEELKKEEFDIGYAHSYNFGATGLLEACGVKTTALLPSGNLVDHHYWFLGIPTPWSFVPGHVMPYSDRMSFWERIKNAAGTSLFLYFYHHQCLPKENAAFKKVYGDSFPKLEELVAKHQLVFQNTDELLDLPRPIMHKVVFIAGVGTSEPKPLSQDWNAMLNKGKKGTILFSMGTVANPSYLPDSIRASLFNGFKKFPDYHFIVRFSGDVPEAKDASNIDIVQWLPQQDMLADNRVKLFFTHGGFNSVHESATAGVPMVVMPLSGDQMGNTIRVEKAGIAVSVDKIGLTQEFVEHAIGIVLHDVRYQERATRLAQMIAKKPGSARERLVSWSKFLAEFKTLDGLQPASAEMSLVQYLNLDVIGLLHVVIFMIMFLLVLVVLGFVKVLKRALSWLDKAIPDPRTVKPNREEGDPPEKETSAEKVPVPAEKAGERAEKEENEKSAELSEASRESNPEE